DRGTGLHVTASATVSAWGSTVQVNANGSFTYTPSARLQGLSAGESIVDRFTYTVADGVGNSGTATVEVLVHGSEDAPVAADDVTDPSLPSLYVHANTTTQISAATLLANDRDPDVNDVLTITAVSTSDPGALVTIVNGSVVYDPRGVAAFNALAA